MKTEMYEIVQQDNVTFCTTFSEHLLLNCEHIKPSEVYKNSHFTCKG